MSSTVKHVRNYGEALVSNVVFQHQRMQFFTTCARDLSCSSNMGWSAILHKNRTFQQLFISQAGDDAILWHIGVPLTLHGSSHKTRITHFLEEKRNDNGRFVKSNPNRDFLVVFMTVLGFLVAQILQLWELTNPRSVKWASSVHNAFTTNGHLPQSFETPTPQMPSASINHQVTVIILLYYLKNNLKIRTLKKIFIFSLHKIICSSSNKDNFFIIVKKSFFFFNNNKNK